MALVIRRVVSGGMYRVGFAARRLLLLRAAGLLLLLLYLLSYRLIFTSGVATQSLTTLLPASLQPPTLQYPTPLGILLVRMDYHAVYEEDLHMSLLVFCVEIPRGLVTTHKTNSDIFTAIRTPGLTECTCFSILKDYIRFISDGQGSNPNQVCSLLSCRVVALILHKAFFCNRSKGMSNSLRVF
jgi:hypothetical protein